MKNIYILTVICISLLSSCSLTNKATKKEKLSQADFSYNIEYIQGYPCLEIKDLAKGNMSVANDINQVVGDIVSWEKIHPRDYIIVYSDKRGSWNAWDARSNRFLVLKAYTYEHAVSAYIAKMAEN